MMVGVSDMDLAEARALAESLRPSIVVVEDVDLIAEDRSQYETQPAAVLAAARHGGRQPDAHPRPPRLSGDIGGSRGRRSQGRANSSAVAPSPLLKRADGALTCRADATAGAMLDRLRGAASLR
jgi:hypothetical protein